MIGLFTSVPPLAFLEVLLSLGQEVQLGVISVTPSSVVLLSRVGSHPDAARHCRKRAMMLWRVCLHNFAQQFIQALAGY